MDDDTLQCKSCPYLNQGLKLDSLKRLYYRRTYERIKDVGDCFEYIVSSHQRKDTKAYYAKRICNRFRTTAIAEVHTDSATYSMQLHKFVYKLAEKIDSQDIIIQIDSIMVPRWDSVAIFHDSVGLVLVPEEIIAPPINDTFYSKRKLLPIVREETEDGYEWTPRVFGDIFITIRRKWKD